MKAIYDVPAPAKLNLFLHVTGRRADGYHLIESVFMLIDWCDTLHFEKRHDGRISRSDIGLHSRDILPAEDLCVRAARALQRASGTTLGAHIILDKRIPSQAGMGGGSSDAASCLMALQRMWRVRLPRNELMAIALELGADVPFFLSGGHAWVQGVGEDITPITLPAADFLVVKPPLGLATQSIFASPMLKRDTGTATIKGFRTNVESKFFGFGCNDLEPVAREFCPQIDQALEWLNGMQLKGRMTGSGSAVFAHLLQDLDLPSHPDDWKVRKCSSLQTHPLVGW